MVRVGARIRVGGELDIATVDELRACLREARQAAEVVQLDLRRIRFMDSAGIHLLVEEAADAMFCGVRVERQTSPGPIC